MTDLATSAHGLKKTVGRQRSACDACHHSKIKCSGGNPCSSCQSSQNHCIYSPGSRLGRPKGSKNKRTILQESKHRRAEEEKRYATNEVPDIFEDQSESQLHTMTLDIGFDTGYEVDFSDFFGTSESPDGIISPSITSFLDPTGANYFHSAGIGNDIHKLYTQTSSLLPASDTSSPCVDGSEFTISSINSSVDELALSPSLRNTLTAESSLKTTSSASGRDSAECTCLQQHVQLVFQLGDLQDPHLSSIPTADRILHGMHMALPPWKKLMHCSRCKGCDNQAEVFLLFATSIRILLSSLQRLKASLSPEKAALLHCELPVSVGSFELSGEMKTEVIEGAIRRGLQHITRAVVFLWERVGRPQPQAQVGNFSKSYRSGKQLSDSFDSRAVGAIASGGDIEGLLRSLQSTTQAMRHSLATPL